ncbi:MAG: thioredoxin [Bacillota bacterium]
MALEINESNFEQEVLQSREPVLLDFWAAWCGPCRSIAPIIEQIADEFKGKMKVGKVNVDENRELAMKFGIKGIPTLLFFKEGKIVGQEVGYVAKDALVDKINSILG